MKRADHGLAEVESARRLNEQLYSAEPHEYFAHRLLLLMLAADRSVDLAEFVRRGIEVDGVNLGPDPDATEDKEGAEQRYRFVLAESLALLHHIAETLLRLYLAHADRPAAPWLALAREPNFTRFKNTVRKRLVTAGELSEAEKLSISAVFHGADFLSFNDSAPTPEQMEAGVENIFKWLSFFAREFLDNASLYNAVKHGLAIQAGNASLTFSESEANEPFFTMVGPTVLFLEERVHEERFVWSTTTRWFSLEETILACQIGNQLIESLWQVARTRYTGADPKRIALFDNPKYSDFVKMPRKSSRGSSQFNLSYYIDEDEDSASE